MTGKRSRALATQGQASEPVKARRNLACGLVYVAGVPHSRLTCDFSSSRRVSLDTRMRRSLSLCTAYTAAIGPENGAEENRMLRSAGDGNAT